MLNVFRIICHDETPQFVNYNTTYNRRGLVFGVRGENSKVLAKSNRDCVILVMHTKMHVFKRPQTSKLISSCTIQYYMLWNLITLQIKIHYWVSCKKKQVHKQTCVLGYTLRLSVEITDQ